MVLFDLFRLHMFYFICLDLWRQGIWRDELDSTGFRVPIDLWGSQRTAVHLREVGVGWNWCTQKQHYYDITAPEYTAAQCVNWGKF